GLRIDHVDGLLDPLAYLVRLRDEITACISAGGKVGEPFPILVEKILTGDERLRNQWPVQGTTGYEFLNELESILVDPAGVSAIEDGYRALLTGAARSRTFRDVAHRGKGRILATSLRADVLRLAGLLAPLARRDANVAKFSQSRLAAALIEWVAGFPVYRTYVDGRGAIAVEDRELIDATAARVRREGASGRAVVPQALADFLRKTMLLTGEGGDRAEQLRAVLRMQQTSGPAAAKGVEDTALYVHVPLVSLNEVGGEPDRPLDDAVHALHEANAARAREWPLNLLCTNTHDTKRSADVRARLDALSEIPDTWLRAVSRWRRINREHRSMIGRRRMPDANTEYLLYQTMVGIWPSPGTGKGADAMPDRAAMASLRERVGEYMLKATREAKVSTSWTDPDEEFESALTTFIGALLHGRGTRSRFLADLATLVERIDVAGRWNAISRLVVHLTSPGTPDLYQGDELWNFALVDPDNRRPVDFARGRRLLASLERRWARGAGARQKLVRELAADPRDDRLKLFLTWRLLHARRERAALVRSGRYEPVRTMGAHATHLISFARTLGASASHADIALTVASRLTLAIGQPGSVPVGQMVWSDTRLQLRRAPGQSGPARWRCLLAGHTIESRADEGHIYLRAADVLAVLPVALLVPA
ncbi:MAG: malto-oligosyltrehalose synthase, partial [Gemmatimonadaceae bacterium]